MTRLAQFLATVAAITGLYSIYSGRELIGRLAVWPWPNPNTGSAVLGLLVASLFGGPILRLRASSTSRILWGGVAIILLVCILLAGTRAALVGVAASIVVCLPLLPNRSKQFYVAVGALSLAAGVGLFVFRDRIFRGDGQRPELWSGFWEIARHQLWLGHGIQNQLHYSVTVSSVSIPAPHSMLLSALLAGGLIAMALLAALYATMVGMSLRCWRNRQWLMPLTMSVYLVVHGLFETVLVTPPSWQWLYQWLPIGVAAGAEILGRPSRFIATSDGRRTLPR
jgi:hypothetical protein